MDSLEEEKMWKNSIYMWTQETGSEDVVSAVCYTIYALSIPLHTLSWDDISRTLFMIAPVCSCVSEHSEHFFFVQKTPL